MTGKYNTHLWIPKTNIKGIKALKKTLEFEHGKNTVKAWNENSEFLIVPREYIPFEDYKGLPFIISNTCPNTYPELNNIKTTYTLRDYVQEEAKAALLKGSGLLVLACGKGKTVITLHAWAKLRVPAFITVPTLDLAHQWKSRILEHTDIKEEEIGWVQGGPDKWDWKNKCITIGVLNTVAKYHQSFNEEFKLHYGIFIYDEVHRLGAPSFNLAASIGYGLRWGLSATPFRSDGLDAIYRYHLGKVLYKNTSQENVPNVYFVKTRVSLNREEERSLLVRGDMHFAKLVTWLSEKEKRNQIINKFLTKCINDGREVLILSDRVDHLKNLHKEHKDSGIIHGTIKGEKREEILLNNKIIFASSKIAKEGLDKKTLNTVFITTPFSDPGMFVQVMGRAQRAPDPVIVIFEDDIGMVKAICKKLRRHLVHLKYNYLDLEVQ